RTFLFLHRVPPRPSPTLFPYTTLFRSVSVRQRRRNRREEMAGQSRRARVRRGSSSCRHPRAAHRRRAVLHRRERLLPSVEARLRSEEHTSELQSPCNLVCRLLLEKKKK